jgi:predicted SAM-dependent methyltransferase
MLRLAKKALRVFLFFLPEQVANSVIFEARAFLGRLFARPLALDPRARNFLNLGSGPLVVPGCINIDFFGVPGIDYGADLRRPLKIADCTVDGIFSEHTIEHLTYAEAGRLLRECHRIMKPGGVIRIVLPDLALFIHRYSDRDEAWFRRWEGLMFTESPDRERAKRRISTPLQAISFVTQEYGHVSAWDFPTLRFYLEDSGFRQVTQAGFMQGRCPELLVDQDAADRRFVSLYVEAVK